MASSSGGGDDLGGDDLGSTNSGVSDSQSRGMVMMAKMKTERSKRKAIELECNELGQPISSGSMPLSDIIESTSRKIFPIIYNDFRNKGLAEMKEQFWDEIKSTVSGVKEHQKKAIISNASSLHRDFRTMLRNLARDADGSYSTEPPALYAHLSTVGPFWKEFVEQASEDDFKARCKLNIERAAQYRRASVDYARLQEQIILAQKKAGEENLVVTRSDTMEYAKRNYEKNGNRPALLMLEDAMRTIRILREYEHACSKINDALAQAMPMEQPERLRDVGCDVIESAAVWTLYISKLAEVQKDVIGLKHKLRNIQMEKGMPSGGSSFHDDLDMDHDHFKEEEEEEEKSLESTSATPDKRLGYPMEGDSSHEPIMLVVLGTMLLPEAVVSYIEVPMNAYFDGGWIERIGRKNAEEILKEQFLSAGTLIFYLRYLGEVYLSKNTELADKFSFLSPRVRPTFVDNPVASNVLIECLLKYVGEDHLILMPNNVGKHWVLIAINTRTESIYYLDPAIDGVIEKHKNLKLFVENAMKTYRASRGRNVSKMAFNNISWINVRCPKQLDSIHCAYYVGCFVEDILVNADTSIPISYVPQNRLMFYPPSKMKMFRINWAGYLYNRFLEKKLSKMM